MSQLALVIRARPRIGLGGRVHHEGRREVARATVALLFSDIEGSTRLLQQMGPTYADVLLEHRRLLRGVFAEHGGRERGTEGDSFFVTFLTASAAVAAAMAAQRALSGHRWPSPEATVRVRIGVHLGEVEELGDTVVGLAVHEAARVTSAGHGGQVLVSQTAAHLAVPLPAGAGWRDLGEHWLKDISEPVHLFQLTHPDLADTFPALRLRAATRNNLPQQPSSFVGRAREVETVTSLLEASRLVTVTGTGGVGKTRIALRVAADQMARFEDGVYLVDLAQVSDPGTVVAQFAGSMNLPEGTVRDLTTAMVARRVLLVVDNCEHVVEAASEVAAELMLRCPSVTLLATSREPLGVPGEAVWRVPPLTREDSRALLDARARSVKADFAVTERNRAAVDEVCDRLDAIPLALELAAARLTSLSVEQVAGRLDQRFRLLAGSTRGAMERHRTLQATVDWSYDLLDPGEQSLLRRLGVFVGGFTLEGAEAVAVEDDPLAVLELVDRLVVKSLVVADERDGSIRYRLLETIRQYALDRLAQTPDVKAARDAQLRWLVELAGSAESALWLGGDEALWLRRLDDEQGNIRSAFEWALSTEPGDAVSILFGVFIWLTARGRSREGLDWARRLLSGSLQGADLALAQLLALCFESNTGPIDVSTIAATRRTAPLLSGSGRPWVEPMTNAYLAAWSYPAGDSNRAAAAIPECERALEAVRPHGLLAVGLLLQPLVWVNLDAGKLDAARRWADEGMAAAAATGASYLESRMGLNRARVDVAAGDPEAAWSHAEHALITARATGETFVAIVATRLMARLAEAEGEHATARDLLTSILDPVAESQPVDVLEEVRADLRRCSELAAQTG
ncbi:MAG: hypothetical protein QOJ60_791 [Actinomycetota bacterium]|nr:hypothetical protein [Actinomycetota bacterium]